MGLDVYLSGGRIGTLSRAGEDGCSFTYAPEAVTAGTTALSRSLPVREEPYGPAETRAYVEGLLPGGDLREALARELCVNPGDSYALIAELGRDCPGAVVFLPEGEAPQPRKADELAWLSREEMRQLVTAPQLGLLDPAHRWRMRFTLPGERHKLALVYDRANDRWAWPEPGVPSTHVVKPQVGVPRDFAINGMACSTALRELGLPIAHTELKSLAGHLCLVSRRYDRWGEGLGVERLHMESFCQATGLHPDSAGARHFGYPQALELLQEIGEEDSVETLFAVAFCNYLVGNDESVHGKGSALLYTAEGPLLAPFPDLASPAVYERPRPRETQRTIFELMRDKSGLGGLAPSPVGSGPELQPKVVRALATASALSDALVDVSKRAKQEGWHAPLIDHIPPRVCAHLFLSGEDFDF